VSISLYYHTFSWVKTDNRNTTDREKLAKAHLRFMDTIYRMKDSLSTDAQADFEENGFAIMDVKQYEILYGRDSPLQNISGTEFNLAAYGKLSKEEKRRIVEAKIHYIAGKHKFNEF
jgi:hypothetical protein